MRRWNLVPVLVLAAVMSTGWAQAQTSDRYDDRDDEGGGRNRDRFALAVGVGLVEPTNEVETYYMAALRIRVGGGVMTTPAVSTPPATRGSPATSSPRWATGRRAARTARGTTRCWGST